MNRRIFLGLTSACAASMVLPLRAATGSEPPPNVVFILADDLGYADLSCYGAAKIRTPHLDRMASEGVKFTDFYAAAAVCTPTRAAFLTGCYPKRVGLHKGVLNNHATRGLHPDEVTLPEVLRGRGYATACIGKWHLGETPETLPTGQGFDNYFGMAGPNHGASDLYRGTAVVEENAKVERDQLTQRYTREAVEFIRKNRDRPFFLYLAHGAPHVPLYASPAFRGKSAAGLYGDMIEELDWSAGQVFAVLEELKLDRRTLVVFTSDNGQADGAAPPLHGGKGSTWEAGLRVPCLVRWPDHVPAGSVCRELAVIFDWLPTLAGLSGAALPPGRIIDGKDIAALIANPTLAKTPHESFVYYSREGRASAVRCGKWKLHVVAPVERWAGKLPPEALLATKPADPLPWLYDLETDIGETRNVARENPAVVARLQSILEELDTRLDREARPVFAAPPTDTPPEPKAAAG